MEPDPAQAPQMVALPDAAAAPDRSLLTEYLAWELHLLGFPVSAHPLDALSNPAPDHIPLAEIVTMSGNPIITAGARLPGWTGGQSFHLSDAATYISVRLRRDGMLRAPQPWAPVLVHGRYQRDEYGSSWMLAERFSELA
jgi:hypothetical protein